MTARQTAGTDPLIGGSGCITWHSTYETTGSAAASYALVDGPILDGQSLMYVTLSQGQSTRDFIGFHALAFINGLFYKEESGAVLGSITAWVDHVCDDYKRKEEMALDLHLAALLGQ